MDNENTNRLCEAKLVLVGEGGVGKTALVKRLLNRESFSPFEKTTFGIEIHKWPIQVNEETVNLNIWDFGGQAIYHTAYQLFYTTKSVYLLVVNARSEQSANRIEYWLKLIQTFGAASSVIIVVTHSDESTLEFDWFGLQRKYKIIKAIAKHVSNKTGEGISELHSLIRNELRQLDNLTMVVPQRWLSIKISLEEINSDYISFADFCLLCFKEGISDEQEQHQLLRMLHNMGAMMHFDNNSQLHNFVILNPGWVLSGLMAVLEDRNIRSQRGLLNIKQLETVWDSERFPPDTHTLFMELLITVEFCVGIGDNENFLVTSNLPVASPNLIWDYENCIGFHYEYDFLPEILFIRFISKIFFYIHKEMYWKTGVVIEFKRGRGLILVDLEDNKIHIYLSGNDENRRDLLSIIRNHFDNIHTSIPEIKLKEFVSLPDYPDRAIDYGLIISLYELGEKSFAPTGISTRIDLNKLIAVFETDQRILEIKVMKEPIRVFLCHSSGDKPQVRKLYKMLVSDNVDAWLDEEKLLPGQEWQLEIPKAVRASDVVVICLSRNSISKAGYIQKEIRHALDVADEQPEGAIYLVPVRLEECEVPTRLHRWQWVDLYQDDGYHRLLKSLITRAKSLNLLHPGDFSKATA